MMQRWSHARPLRRGFMLLAAVLFAVCIGFIALITIELIAPSAYSVRANSQNDLKNTHLVEQGAYLAVLGNCAACHTERGGAAFAGGKAIHTPFGAVFASNITPDAQHGIGAWSAEAFYRALHEGISANGKLLTPAFPYPNTTHISRADSDALYAYFMQAVQPVAQANRPHELQWPFNTQLALAAWRVLFFEKGSGNTINSIALSAYSIRAEGQNVFKNEVERGRYIVQGLAHCSACHAQRNALGATRSDGLLSGALMPMQDWYAPSLHARDEAGVQHWPREQIASFLKNGVVSAELAGQSHNASALGPMAEVVAKSTQHWAAVDLQATAAYLQSLPVQAASPKRPAAATSVSLQRGAALYTQHCATCHGAEGQGLQERDQASAQGIVHIPALAGNRAIELQSSANLVRIILAGGYAPATSGNPHPYGMPPFVHVLSDEDIADVATYIRSSWGHQAGAVTASQVIAQRRGVLQ
jgi:mono/diheme cytochrome c family protein